MTEFHGLKMNFQKVNVMVSCDYCGTKEKERDIIGIIPTGRWVDFSLGWMDKHVEICNECFPRIIELLIGYSKKGGI